MKSMSDSEYLPEFSQEWLNQWQRARSELAKVRDAELRSLTSSDVARATGVLATYGPPESSGLVIQQRWFMRQRLLQLLDANRP